MSLWRWQDLLQALELSAPETGADVGGISIDTRTLEPGDLFVALGGEPHPRFRASLNRDGHDFVDAAERAGAGALLVSRKVSSPLPALAVKNTLEALWQLARASRERMHASVVGITGSAGKTTARYWLQEILTAQSTTHGSVGSYNNHWGVPLSLARMPEHAMFGVFEIGMNHPGEIAPLSQLVSPDVALITNVLPAHLGNMGSLEAIRQEKLSILEGLRRNGSLVIPFGLDTSGVRDCHLVTFGTDARADVRGTLTPSGVRVHIEDLDFELTLRTGGEHRLQTALAVLAVVHVLGADVESAVTVLNGLAPPPGRGNEFEIAGRTVIDDSYNANPVSMGYALDALSTHPAERRIALIGEMLELGAEAGAMHQAVIEKCRQIDVVITVGSGFDDLPDTSGLNRREHFGSVLDLDETRLMSQTRRGDVILVKGANKVFWANGFVDRFRTALSSIQPRS